VTTVVGGGKLSADSWRQVAGQLACVSMAHAERAPLVDFWPTTLASLWLVVIISPISNH